jgi:hypothetical protein
MRAPDHVTPAFDLGVTADQQYELVRNFLGRQDLQLGTGVRQVDNSARRGSHAGAKDHPRWKVESRSWALSAATDDISERCVKHESSD